MRSFDLSPDSLSAAIVAAIGVDLPRYITEKRRALETLGYDEDRLLVTTTLSFRDEEHLMDAFLGLAEVDAGDLRTIETRFGIPLPLAGLPPIENGRLTIEPTGESNCTVVVRTGLSVPPLSFEGELMGPPGEMITGANWKFRVKTRFFEFVVTPATFKWTSAPSAFTLEAPFPETWAFAKLLQACTFESTSLEIRYGDAGFLTANPSPAELSETQLSRWRAIGGLFDTAKRVLDKLGRPDHRLTVQNVIAAADQLKLLDAWFTDTARLDPWSFTVKATMPWPGGEPPPVLFVHVTELFDLRVAIAAVGQMSVTAKGLTSHWTSQTLELAGVQVIGDGSDNFDRFVEDATQQTGIHNPVVTWPDSA